MEIIPNYCDIAVSENSIQTGCLTIDETKSNIIAVYEELTESNESLLKELTGDMKTAFEGAKDTTEKRLGVVTAVLTSLSMTLRKYSNQNQGIDKNAGVLAGGKIYE